MIPSSAVMHGNANAILEVNTDEAECIFAALGEIESSLIDSRAGSLGGLIKERFTIEEEAED